MVQHHSTKGPLFWRASLAFSGACLALACGGGSGGGGAELPQVAAACGQPTVGEAGKVMREYYLGYELNFVRQFVQQPAYISHTPTGRDSLTSLKSQSWYPGDTSTMDWASSFGEEIRGFIKAPTSGDYTFWVAGDNQTQFYLSPDETVEPATKALAADMPRAGTINYVKPGTFDEVGQKSAPITLRAGQYYYFIMMHVSWKGSTHAEVRWSLPGEALIASSAVTVPGTVLYYPNFPMGADCADGAGAASAPATQ